MRHLTLYIPGLMPPFSDLLPQDIPPVPSIETIFARGDREARSASGFSHLLCSLFDLQGSEDNDLPVAALSHLVDDDHSPDKVWMRADPVHLSAKSNSVVLLDESSFTLDQHDALVLAAGIRDILAEHGWILEAPTTNRWYIQSESMPRILTTAIHEVVGHEIHRHLPVGEDQSDWHRLINEIQMCLHASQINEERQKRGELPVNSVWFWGGGSVPEQTSSRWTRVFSDEEIAHGLAKHANLPFAELPGSVDELLDQVDQAENMLAVMSFGLRHNQYRDLDGWRDFIAYLEQFWFTGLLNFLKSGKLDELVILNETQMIKFNKLSLYKFWKEQKSINLYP